MAYTTIDSRRECSNVNCLFILEFAAESIKKLGKIIPEFPLAPTKAASATAFTVTAKFSEGGIMESMIERTVETRLVPVSASLTGKH